MVGSSKPPPPPRAASTRQRVAPTKVTDPNNSELDKLPPSVIPKPKLKPQPAKSGFSTSQDGPDTNSIDNTSKRKKMDTSNAEAASDENDEIQLIELPSKQPRPSIGTLKSSAASTCTFFCSFRILLVQ